MNRRKGITTFDLAPQSKTLAFRVHPTPKLAGREGKGLLPALSYIFRECRGAGASAARRGGGCRGRASGRCAAQTVLDRVTDSWLWGAEADKRIQEWGVPGMRRGGLPELSAELSAAAAVPGKLSAAKGNDSAAFRVESLREPEPTR
eukprot:CAMPEP_0173406366 /NCGR_PEP_ID=MMETSP1356-20130122/64454_1 /TAXON_ID=77927 ORGANISM="Hemiselmis virescens, Strain PCC157" /NCGR_SAMPLE_ID=MMETSP1356 /ASSEMBLY_ACC=CAM_ASM_000847 /LENGTH=146 /DNA_ID=CAMNT_0014367345 /DNA_START=19 /DNA_END=457 /DNA_ORIENTATION=+